ncbi:MAG: hypothetical protein WDA20_12305 [Desulfuromonadales bacterium]|jgi:hypothetical protein
MSSKKMSARETVNTRCSFCEAAKDHTVIATLTEDTVRIQCGTCDSTQDYKKIARKRPAVKPGAKKAKPLTKGKTDPAVAEGKEWTLLRPNMNAEKAVAYDMDGRYQAKALLLHSAFGLGLVMRVAGPHKVEVLFESGKKLLRCH